MCGKNAALLLEELKLQRMKSEDFVTKSVLALQEELKLPQLPRRIEGFDISNIQGKEPVASMVSFLNGMANKSEYRKFKIRSKTTPDDFLMMKEVVGRRYARILKEKKILPDLVLIDGGKGQLNAALEALKELSIVDLPIISLAKRLDEVFVPGISEPQNIHKGSPALHLLQRVRDESHRFAVTFHRTLRKKTTLASELDSIPGIGPARRKLLLKHFGAVQNIMNASYEDLLKVKTIAPKIAEKIAGHFHKLKEQSS